MNVSLALNLTRENVSFEKCVFRVTGIFFISLSLHNFYKCHINIIKLCNINFLKNSFYTNYSFAKIEKYCKSIKQRDMFI